MLNKPQVMNTDEVAADERVAFWGDWLGRLFQGLKSDEYGDTDFHGRASTLHAGDVVLTHLEATRHRVTRSSAIARATGMPYLRSSRPGSAAPASSRRGARPG